VDNFQFGPKGGAPSTGSGPASPASGLPKGSEGQSSADTGGNNADEIKYPDEEINPEDIPF